MRGTPIHDRFKYHQLDDADRAKVDAIKAAETACSNAIQAAMQTLGQPEVFGAINEATATFAQVVEDLAPECGLRERAIDAADLCRNAANESRVCARPMEQFLINMAAQKLLEARFLAVEAVALGAKGLLPESVLSEPADGGGLEAVLGALERGEISMGRAARMMRVSRATMIMLASQHGIPSINYPAGELAEELQALDKALARGDIRLPAEPTGDHIFGLEPRIKMRGGGSSLDVLREQRGHDPGDDAQVRDDATDAGSDPQDA